MKPGKRKKRHASFVGLSRKTLKSKEWRTGLSSSAKVLYLHLKYKFVGYNNGNIMLHYSEIDFMAPATASRAFKELGAKGWIIKTRFGGLYRYSTKFELTGKYDDAFINDRF